MIGLCGYIQQSAEKSANGIVLDACAELKPVCAAQALLTPSTQGKVAVAYGGPVIFSKTRHRSFAGLCFSRTA